MTSAPSQCWHIPCGRKTTLTFAPHASTRYPDRAGSPSTYSPRSKPSSYRQGQRCRGGPSEVHPLPTGSRYMEDARKWTTPVGSLQIKRIPIQTPSVDVSVKRYLSWIFPCLTRPLARCLSRAQRQLRGSALHFVLPAGFGFQKIFSANLRIERGRKDFPNLPKKRRLALGAWHLPSLRARVPRVRTGQIQTGEKQWHSTKTIRS
jgi:hypothetical protein